MTSGGRGDGGLAGSRRGAAPWVGHLREDRRGAGLGPEFGGWGGATPPARASPRGLSAAVPSGRPASAGRWEWRRWLHSPRPPGILGLPSGVCFLLNPRKVENCLGARRPLGPVGNFPAFLCFLGPQVRTPLERAVLRVTGGAPARVSPAPIVELSRLTFQASRSRKYRPVLGLEGRQADGWGRGESCVPVTAPGRRA